MSVGLMSYQVPRKSILSADQLAATTDIQQRIISYIELLNEAVVGKKLTDECSQSEAGGFEPWFYFIDQW